MVNNPLTRPYFLGVGIGGVPLDSHDYCSIYNPWTCHLSAPPPKKKKKLPPKTDPNSFEISPNLTTPSGLYRTLKPPCSKFCFVNSELPFLRWKFPGIFPAFLKSCLCLPVVWKESTPWKEYPVYAGNKIRSLIFLGLFSGVVWGVPFFRQLDCWF